MNYLQALSAVCQPIHAGDYPDSLRPMHDLLDALSNPHAGIPAVVIAGSTGKGTTCYHLARLLRANDLHVGLYTSPHLHSFRERFVFNDMMISESEFIEGVEVVRRAASNLNHTYSTFEQATALALWWFARRKADILVLEVGLGGRFDAVNAVDNTLAVFTPIEAEHVAMLGGSLPSVVWHKAGIIEENGHALTVQQTDDVFAILSEEARLKNAHLNRLNEEGQVALASWQNLLDREIIPRRTLVPGLELRSLPGRLEQVKIARNSLLIDGGHTPASASFLRREIERIAGLVDPVRVIVGMLQDKSGRDYLEEFDAPRFHVVLTQAPGHRASSPEALREQARFQYAQVEMVSGLEDALEQARTAHEELVVIAGSLRLAAAAREFYGLLHEDVLAEAQATREIFDGRAYLARLDATKRRFD